jgi:uncharacterized protein with ATP-grasp and redox domains
LIIDDTTVLKNFLAKSKNVLYLLDNAGEIVFDKFFIKVIRANFNVKVWAAVKEKPILNDVTLEDADQIKLGDVSNVITTGDDQIGFKLERCSKKFIEKLRKADLIIAKGQGYFESITEIEHFFKVPIAYIFKVKCNLIAEMLNINQNGNIVKVVNRFKNPR